MIENMPVIINTLKNYNEDFDTLPYNKIDALVFSLFIYMPIGRIDIPTYIGSEYVIELKDKTLKEIATDLLNNKILFNERFYDSADEDLNVPSERESFYAFYEAIINSNRYANLKIKDFDVKLNSNKDDICQFCAFFLEIKENNEYVAINRGTDRTMEGWYEDYKMIYNVQNAQFNAKDFLNKMLGEYNGIVHVTGHSKGGCNAYYSFLECDEKYLPRLDLIIFDALYFNKTYAEKNKEKMRNLSDQKKCTFINVENSFFGELLFGLEYCANDDNFCHIKSTSKKLIAEHYLYTMEIKDNDFIIVEQSNQSKLLSEFFRTNFVDNKKEAIVFCETAFNILGIDTKESILNNHLTTREKLILVIQNILKQKDNDLIIASKVFNTVYKEANMIFSFKDAESLNELLSKDADLKENKYISNLINNHLLKAFYFSNILDVEKFKLNLKVVLKIMGEHTNKNPEKRKIEELLKAKRELDKNKE